jgi:DNA-binding NarL/FixJ family response regulator
MSPSIARKVTQSFSQANQGKRDIKMMLTQREIEIIEMISKGKLEKEVASDLFISIKTVKNHITNIYHKLHVTTRVEALNKYFGKF